MDRPFYSVLFLGKRDDGQCEEAADFCRRKFNPANILLGDWGDPLPDALTGWSGDLIVSLRSRWIVPPDVLRKALIASINFHPAPPEYPGIGCTNFALYDQVTEYGVTCHKMVPTVDTGDIISVDRFSVHTDDNVESLTSRTHHHQMKQFYNVMAAVLNDRIPESREVWKRKPYTRKDLNELSRITMEMDVAEVERRIRATRYRKWKPIVEVAGYEFELKTEE